MTAGRVGLFALALVVATSMWRKAPPIEYDSGRRLHIGFTIVATLLALFHAAAAGSYTGEGRRRAPLVGRFLPPLAREG